MFSLMLKYPLELYLFCKPSKKCLHTLRVCNAFFSAKKSFELCRFYKPSEKRLHTLRCAIFQGLFFVLGKFNDDEVCNVFLETFSPMLIWTPWDIARLFYGIHWLKGFLKIMSYDISAFGITMSIFPQHCAVIFLPSYMWKLLELSMNIHKNTMKVNPFQLKK